MTSMSDTIHSGDAYCGSGCSSNCDAKAECGQNAVPAGKKCPLNTW
jgi:chitinase